MGLAKADPALDPQTFADRARYKTCPDYASRMSYTAIAGLPNAVILAGRVKTQPQNGHPTDFMNAPTVNLRREAALTKIGVLIGSGLAAVLGATIIATNPSPIARSKTAEA